MARLFFQPPAGLTAVWYRFDTASGTDSPASPLTAAGGQPIEGSRLRAGVNLGHFPGFYGPEGVTTLYRKQLTEKEGVPTDTPLALAGIDETPSSVGVGAGAAGGGGPSILDWAPNTPYAASQLVWQGGLLQRRKAAGTSGATFDQTQWDSAGSGTYGPLVRLDRTQSRQFIPLASRAAPPFGASTPLSDGTVTGGTGRLRHKVLITGHGVVLAFSNFYNNNGTETDGTNDITVRAAFEPSNGQKIPVTFAGQFSVTIPPGATVYSDPIGVSVVRGSFCWTDTYVVVASAAKFPQGGFTTVAGGGEGHNYASVTGADLTAPGSAFTGLTAGSRVFGPSAILGLPTTPGPSVVLVGGDSIAAGTGDSGTGLDAGWILRALNDNYSVQSIAYPSETVDAWYATNGLNKRRGRAILERVGGTHAVCELGVNSLTQPLATLLGPHLIGDGQRGVWSNLASLGVPVWQSTITPQTSSTDAWATTVNQTVLSSSNEANRVLANAWLRDGAPITAAPAAGGVFAATGTVGALRAGQAGHPLAGILEVADLAETARNSGIWKAGYTTDGTHPSATGAAAMGAALVPASLGLTPAA